MEIYSDIYQIHIHVNQMISVGFLLFPGYDVCGSHGNELVTIHCQTCSSAICVECFMDLHRGHTIKDIASLADECRVRIWEFVNDADALKDEEEYIKLVKFELTEIRDVQTKFRQFSSDFGTLLKDSELKFELASGVADAKLSAEIKGLELLENDSTDLLVSKKSLLDYGNLLVEKASDPEMVAREATFPRWQSNPDEKPHVFHTISNMSQIESFKSALTQLTASFQVEYVDKNLSRCDSSFNSSLLLTPQPPLLDPKRARIRVPLFTKKGVVFEEGARFAFL